MKKKAIQTVKRRLIISFSILILFILVFGLYAIHNVNTISGLTRIIYDHPLVVSNAALQANIAISKIHRNIKDVVLFQNPERIRNSIEAVKHEERKVYQYFDIIREKILGDEGERLENETRKLFDAWRPIRMEVINLVHSNQKEKAAEITIGKGAVQVFKLEKKMSDLTNYARSKATVFIQDTESAKSRITSISLFFLLFGIIGSTLIAFFTIRRTLNAERILQEKTNFLDTILEASALSTWISDAKGTAIRTNPACLKFFGATEDEVIGKYNLFQDAVIKQNGFIPAIEKVFETGEVANIIIDYDFGAVDHVEVKNATHKIINSIFTPIIGRDGKVSHAVVQTIDLTEIKKAETAYKESEKKLRAVLDATPFPIAVVDLKDDIIHFWSRSAETLFGHIASTTAEWYEIAYPDPVYRQDVIQRWKAFLEIARKSGKPVNTGEYRVSCSDGSERLCELHATFLPNDLIVTFNDITARKKAEQALAQEKEWLSVTLRSIGDGVITTDIKGKVVLINKIAEKLTGWKQEEAFGKDLNKVFNIINAHTRQKCENPVEKVLEVKRIIGLANHTNLIARDGTERMIADSGAPIFNVNSEIVGFVLVFRDVTKQYKIEKHLQQTQKLESIGVLAGGIAHDFNNMLGVITGNISYALSVLNHNDELFDVLSDVQEGAKNAQNLTQQLLTFAKGGEPVKAITDINRIVKESATFVLRGTKSKCRFEFADDLWITEVDKGQLNQVISNLVINANQAMPQGGVITLQTENENITAESNLPLPAGKYIKITIEDSGIGISEKHLPNIFDPYFSTKQQGSGLGLATTHSIIKKHEGHITVYSELGKRTVFHLYLPASLKVFEQANEAKAISHQGHGRILIMDDQESILKMVGKMLNKMGYATTFAKDGTEAIEAYRKAYESDNTFDLVILDLTVPGAMGGANTIPELLKIDPKVKAVVSSGYSKDPIMSNYRDYGFCSVIPKPYTKDRLADILGTIL